MKATIEPVIPRSTFVMSAPTPTIETRAHRERVQSIDQSLQHAAIHADPYAPYLTIEGARQALSGNDQNHEATDQHRESGQALSRGEGVRRAS